MRAGVAKSADAGDLKSLEGINPRAGSTPAPGTTLMVRGEFRGAHESKEHIFVNLGVFAGLALAGDELKRARQFLA